MFRPVLGMICSFLGEAYSACVAELSYQARVDRHPFRLIDIEDDSASPQ